MFKPRDWLDRPSLSWEEREAGRRGLSGSRKPLTLPSERYYHLVQTLVEPILLMNTRFVTWRN
jgi:hypothetical protein